MIEIEKSLSADTRTAKGDIDKETLLKSTKQHIGDVKKACDFFINMLRDAATKHDHSKIELIDEFHHDFIEGLHGKDFKKSAWYNKHIQERHHLHSKCPEDVNLIDVIEMIADIVVAGMARSGEVYDDKLDSSILELAFKNTVEMLKKEIKIVDNNDIFNTPIEK